MQDSASSIPDPLLGQVLLGRFLVSELVSRSPDIIVYAGTDTRTNKPVRIQRPVTLQLNPEQAAAVKSVAPTLARLKAEPTVLGPLDGGIHAGVPFLVLAPLSGGTLADRLRHRGGSAGTVSSRSCRPWLEAVAAALDAAHQLGCVHGRLTPESIVIASDGTTRIDGFPASVVLNALKVRPRGPSAGAVVQTYRAPEVASDAKATAASDQYSLAAIVAEVVGTRPRAVEKALFDRPDQRHSSCVAFAAELLAELDASTTGPARVGSAGARDDAPLELAAAEPSGASAAQGQPFDLELEEIETSADLRSARRKASSVEEEDLSDIVFTKPGQTLTTPKSVYHKAADLAGARASWRRMTDQYKSLSKQRQVTARLVIGCIALLVALWAVRAGWRAVDSLVRSGRSLAEGAVRSMQPNVNVARETGEEFFAQMKSLWSEHVLEDEDIPAGSLIVADSSAPPAPDRMENSAWPARPQDVLLAEQIREPTGLIADLTRNKGAFTREGLGVFHVDDPRFADQQSWIGGFGLLRKAPGESKPLLHGTLVHRAENGDIFVAQYLRGRISRFYCVEKSPTKENFIVFANMMTRNDEPIRDGAAFVLGPDRATCLALVFQDGEAVGGKWCDQKTEKDGSKRFETPAVILSVNDLEAQDSRFSEYLGRLEQAAAAVPDIEADAKAELRKFVRNRKLK